MPKKKKGRQQKKESIIGKAHRLLLCWCLKQHFKAARCEQILLSSIGSAVIEFGLRSCECACVIHGLYSSPNNSICTPVKMAQLQLSNCDVTMINNWYPCPYPLPSNLPTYIHSEYHLSRQHLCMYHSQLVWIGERARALCLSHPLILIGCTAVALIGIIFKYFNPFPLRRFEITGVSQMPHKLFRIISLDFFLSLFGDGNSKRLVVIYPSLCWIQIRWNSIAGGTTD